MASTGAWKPLIQGPRKDDSIVEAASLVVPLLLKTSEPDEWEHDDEVQILSERGSNSKSVDAYVKEAYVAALTKKRDNDVILSIRNYYESTAGQMLMDLGLRQVAERNLASKTKKLSNQIKKMDHGYAELVKNLELVKNELLKVQTLNKPFKPKVIYRCPHCRFSTEFKIVLQGHLEVPHIDRKEYHCNWCNYKNKSADETIQHYLLTHKHGCKIEYPLSTHMCSHCTFETNLKPKMLRHIKSCNFITFAANKFLGPQNYSMDDYPGVTSRFITQEDIKAYERTRNALLLSSYNPHQVNIAGLNENGAQRRVTIVPSRYLPKNTNHVVRVSKPENIDLATTVCNPLQNFTNSPQKKRLKRTSGVNNQSKILGLASAEHNLLPALQQSSVLQHPRLPSLFVNGKSVVANATGVIMAPPTQHANIQVILNNSSQIQTHPGDSISRQGSSVDVERGLITCSKTNRASSSKKSNFIICEICDYYIKDLVDLRSHMESIHEVKMKQTSPQRRPPLSCLKCKWRFFTDHGLERHLLGVHSLVTSNFQDQADRGKDSGRCTVCGKAFSNKLVQHMKDVHKANLKLAHLSYKCTICTATFNLYSHFENHVTDIHPESVGTEL